VTGTELGGFSLPCRRHVLANGLVVLVHEDHSVPLLATNLWYRVGSAMETPGRSGFAHLFEHLMFMGTRRVPTRMFDAWMEAAGARNRAWTSADRTRYLSWGPPETLPLILWLEADRLSSLGTDLTQENLDSQREVVRSERRETVENAPYGRLEEYLLERLYPPGHPYRHGTMGSHEDLQAASLRDVQEFFARWYGPDNAILGIAGAVAPDEAFALVERYFGWIPRRHAPPPPPCPAAFRIAAGHREILLDDVQLHRLTMAWQGPARGQPGEAELDLAVILLAGGATTRLEKALVHRHPLAETVSVHHGVGDFGSRFLIDVVLREGASVDEVAAVLDEELHALASTGPSEHELVRARNVFLTRIADRLESFAERATQLCLYEATRGDPAYLAADLERHRAVTAPGLRETVAATLTATERITVHVAPGLDRRRTNGTSETSAPPPRARSTARPRPLARFDPLGPRPEVPPTTPFTPPVPVSFSAACGMTVWLVERHAIPVVTLTLAVKAGSAADPLGMEGLAHLTAEAMCGGAVDELGATHRPTVTSDGSFVSLTVPAANVAPALKQLAAVAAGPDLGAPAWETTFGRWQDSLRRRSDHPKQVALITGRAAAYGIETGWGHPANGLLRAADRIDLAAVRSFRAAHWRPGGALLAVSGAITRDELAALVETSFGAWTPVPVAVDPAPRATPAMACPRLVLVDRPGAPQTAIAVVQPSVAASHPDAARLELLAMALGGSFTSRLNQKLREERGWSYGVQAWFDEHRQVGAVVVQTAVSADATMLAIDDIWNELTGMARIGPTADETEKARAQKDNDLVQEYARTRDVSHRLATLYALDLAPTADRDASLRWSSASHADLAALAKAHLDPGQATIVLVGCRQTIEAQRIRNDLGRPEIWDAQHVAPIGGR
jgi:zinc protease